MSAATVLRQLLNGSGLVVMPGAADALTARLIEQAGFPSVYATGAGIANGLFGLPDLGLTTLTDVADQARRMTAAVSIPLLVDADTGYGNPLNVIRTVQELERAGVAGLQLEDQVSPKRCGHFAGKEVVPAEEMVQKLRAAVYARKDADLVILGRTDAIATHGFEEAVRRARLYVEAGADAIFVEAPETLEQWRDLPSLIKAPLVANMTEGGKSPDVTPAQLEEFGYRIALFPNTALRVAMRAVSEAMARLKEERTSAGFIDLLATWKERQDAVDLPAFDALERRFVRGEN